ncbi:MAG: hypothetical protein M3680_25380 [Myxococcota bacterium]|nr:hypothetical protein [Myxococcota bacterium]
MATAVSLKGMLDTIIDVALRGSAIARRGQAGEISARGDSTSTYLDEPERITTLVVGASATEDAEAVRTEPLLSVFCADSINAERQGPPRRVGLDFERRFVAPLEHTDRAPPAEALVQLGRRDDRTP